MRKISDRYPELGPKRRILEENVINAVRDIHPKAYREGSTGLEATWWIKTDDGPELVAHHWWIDNPRFQNPIECFVRIKP